MAGGWEGESKMIVPWTDEQNRLLRELCDAKLKSHEIAAEINRRTGSHFTRNSVIGKTRRTRCELPVAAGSHGPRSRMKNTPPAPPKPHRWKPGRLLMQLGWLDGAFR